MNRRALLLGASALLVAAAPYNSISKGRRVSGRPIIFYAPHQDDFLLFGGRIGAHHALPEVGRRLIVVTGTDGRTTSVRRKLNGELSSAYWQGTHDPVAEGYSLLSETDIAAVRDREEVNADMCLGAVRSDIHLQWSVPHQGGYAARGANITVEVAESLIRHFEGLYPDTGHYAMWPGDQDPNHAAMGQALLNLHLADPVRYGDVRWMVRPSEKVAAGALTYDVPAEYDSIVNTKVRRACRAYDAWAPHEGMFAVGYHSVQSLFLAVQNGEPNYYLKPTASALDAFR